MTHEKRKQLRKQMADAIAAGASIADACEEFDVGRQVVVRGCLENQVSLPERPETPKLESAERVPRVYNRAWQILAALLNTTETAREIAIRFSVSHQAVCHIATKAKNFGIWLPYPRVSTQRRAADMLRKRMAERLNEGLTVRAVADEFDVSEATVTATARRYGTRAADSLDADRTQRARWSRIIAELQNTDDSQSMIAERLSVSRMLVSTTAKYARQAGMRVPNRTKGVPALAKLPNAELLEADEADNNGAELVETMPAYTI